MVTISYTVGGRCVWVWVALPAPDRRAGGAGVRLESQTSAQKTSGLEVGEGAAICRRGGGGGCWASDAGSDTFRKLCPKLWAALGSLGNFGQLWAALGTRSCERARAGENAGAGPWPKATCLRGLSPSRGLGDEGGDFELDHARERDPFQD